MPTLANVQARGCAARWLFRERRESVVALFPGFFFALRGSRRCFLFLLLPRPVPSFRLHPFRVSVLPFALPSGAVALFRPSFVPIGREAVAFLALLLSAFRLSLSAVRFSLHCPQSFTPSLSLSVGFYSCSVEFICNRPPFPPSFGLDCGACQGLNLFRPRLSVHSCPSMRSVLPCNCPHFTVAASRHGKALPPVRREGLAWELRGIRSGMRTSVHPCAG